jgi:hypothetical protein
LASIAASPTDDVRHHESLARAATWLEDHAQDGKWSNEAALYTSVPQIDYYEAPFMTHCIATLALQTYRTALDKGANAAVAKLFG